MKLHDRIGWKEAERAWQAHERCRRSLLREQYGALTIGKVAH